MLKALDYPTLRTLPNAVAHPRASHRDRTDAGHDLSLGQVGVANQAAPAMVRGFVRVPLQQCRNLGFDRMRQKRAGTIAQSGSIDVLLGSWSRSRTNSLTSGGLRNRHAKRCAGANLENAAVGHPWSPRRPADCDELLNARRWTSANAHHGHEDAAATR
jgi:hypothetical protein